MCAHRKRVRTNCPFSPTSPTSISHQYGIIYAVSKTAKVSGSVVAGFPSPAEQYQEPPLDLNELLVKRPAATYFVRVEGDSMVGSGIRPADGADHHRHPRAAQGRRAEARTLRRESQVRVAVHRRKVRHTHTHSHHTRVHPGLRLRVTHIRRVNQ